MSEEEQEMEQCYCCSTTVLSLSWGCEKCETRDEAQPCVAQRNVLVEHRKGESGLTCHEGYRSCTINVIGHLLLPDMKKVISEYSATTQTYI